MCREYEIKKPLYVLCAVVCAVCLAGCSVTRAVDDRVNEVTHTDNRSTFRVDTVVVVDTLRVMERDTLVVGSRDRGSVDIRRDSVGRPVFISWDVTTGLNAVGARSVDQNVFHLGRGSSRQDTCATIADTRRDTYTRSRLETGAKIVELIGVTTLALIAIYVVYVIIHDGLLPWYRQRRKQ